MTTPLTDNRISGTGLSLRGPAPLVLPVGILLGAGGGAFLAKAVIALAGVQMPLGCVGALAIFLAVSFIFALGVWPNAQRSMVVLTSAFWGVGQTLLVASMAGVITLYHFAPDHFSRVVAHIGPVLSESAVSKWSFVTEGLSGSLLFFAPFYLISFVLFLAITPISLMIFRYTVLKK